MSYILSLLLKFCTPAFYMKIYATLYEIVEYISSKYRHNIVNVSLLLRKKNNHKLIKIHKNATNRNRER